MIDCICKEKNNCSTVLLVWQVAEINHDGVFHTSQLEEKNKSNLTCPKFYIRAGQSLLARIAFEKRIAWHSATP